MPSVHHTGVVIVGVVDVVVVTRVPIRTSFDTPHFVLVTRTFNSPAVDDALLLQSTTSMVSLQETSVTVPMDGVKATEISDLQSVSSVLGIKLPTGRTPTFPKCLPNISIRLPVLDLVYSVVAGLGRGTRICAICVGIDITPFATTVAYIGPAFAYEVPPTVIVTAFADASAAIVAVIAAP